MLLYDSFQQRSQLMWISSGYAAVATSSISFVKLSFIAAISTALKKRYPPTTIAALLVNLKQ